MPFFRRKPRPLPSLDAYARWAATYPPEAHNALMRAEEDALLALLPPLDGRIVLDAACGSWRYLRIALERGARCVIGTDNSWDMLHRVPAHPSARSMQHLVLSTLDSLPLADASIDVAICGLAIGHLPRIEQSFAELARVLVPGGCALVSDVHPFLFLGGAQRTFESGGRTYAVEHTVHLYSVIHAAAAAVNLQVDALREPRLLPEDRTDRTPGAPVAIIYRLAKAHGSPR